MSAEVWGAQECVGLLSREKPDLRPRAALVRDGQNALNLRRVGWHLERCIPKERAKGGQSQVSAYGADATAGLHVFKESGDQRCIDLLEGQLLRRNTEPLLRELQKQPKAVPVRSDGVGAGLALLHQPVCEEALQERGKAGRRHCRPSQCCSRRVIAKFISAGWALRYQ